MQVNPQLVPLQVALPFVGTAQAVQDAPHVRIEVLSAQVLPQAWKPVLHATPQLVPSQVAVPFVGVAQGVQELPHVAALLLATQAPPHAW